MKITKKQKIIDLFNDAEWIGSPAGHRIKVITHDDFYDAGFNPYWEYGEKYNDVLYAKRILKEMGFTITIGSTFCVNDYSQKP